MALEGHLDLFVSAEVLAEIHELPLKNIGVERGITLGTVREFTDELLNHATFIDHSDTLRAPDRS
jgi:hypothetical protein